MRRARLVVIGVVAAGSVGLGAAVGAVAFTPAVSFAAADDASAEASVMVCAGILGSGPIGVAAETIGIQATDLLAAVRDGATIAEVAEDHGVESQAVIDAIVSSRRELLDAAVESGRLTRAQADALGAHLEERAAELVNDPFDLMPLWSRPPLLGRPGVWGLAEGPLVAAAGAIGIQPVELMRSVHDGASIAEVAEDHGIAADVVIDAVAASLQQRLDSALANGWITRAEADERAAGLERQAAAIVNGDLPPLPFPRPGDRGRWWIGRPGGAIDLGPSTAEPSPA